MFNKKIIYSILYVAIIVFSFSCDKRELNVAYPPSVTDNVATVAQKNGLTIFANAITLAQMDSAFQYLGQYTLFAPTDAAFNAAGITSANVTSVAPATLRSILRNHILPGRTTSFSFLPGPNAGYGNINRDFVYTSTYLTTSPGVGTYVGTYFNGIKILQTDILANNGVIHTIDGVLLPAVGNLTASLLANPNLTFLEAAINRAGLASTLNNATSSINLLAPTNAAFQAAGFPDKMSIDTASSTVLSNILRLHVIPAASVPAAVGNGRLFIPDFRTGNYVSLNGNVATTVTGSSVTFRGASNTTGANIVTPNVLFRTLVSTGAPSVMQVIDKVLLP
jgi:uncharacterized surface protein with fasciclin (FAS1) repeats